MTTISIANVRRLLTEVVNAARYGKERTVLMRHNKPVAAIIPMEDYELLEALEDRIDLQEAREILEDPDREFLDWDQARTKL